MNDNTLNGSSSTTRRSFIKNSSLTAMAMSLASLPTQSTAKETSNKKIKALYVTGGGHHDFEAQKKILPAGVSKLIDVEWTIWHHDAEKTKQALSEKGWADPFDVILYNICHANESDENYINSVVEVHMAGKPMLAIHCTLHSYHWQVGGGKHSKNDKEWNKLLGVVSLNHGPRGPAITVAKSDIKHPAYNLSEQSWSTPKGELYNIQKVYPSATVLAKGSNGKAEHPVVWVNKYGKGNVFGTSIGHHNETMETPEFQKLIADGMTWLVNA